MTLKARISADMKSALKSGDKARLSVVRMLLAAIKQKEVDERRELDDGDVLGVLEKMVKQRRDSVTQFEAGGRSDLAEKERSEIDVLNGYLPEPLAEEALAALIDQAITDTGAESPRDMGRVMGRIKEQARGRVDMGAVSARVRARLAQ